MAINKSQPPLYVYTFTNGHLQFSVTGISETYDKKTKILKITKADEQITETGNVKTWDKKRIFKS